MHNCGYLTSWERTVAPDRTKDPLIVSDVRDNHLRAMNDEAEDEYIERLIRVSLDMAQRRTRRLLLPQTWTFYLSGFPCTIEIPKGPVLSVNSITVEGGDVLTGSPAQFLVENPTLTTNQLARVTPLSGESWPSVTSQLMAVALEIELGYPLNDDGYADIPEEINMARLLIIGELYKQRSLSVHAPNQNPAILRAHDIFMGYRLY